MSGATATGATLPARLIDRARQIPDRPAYRHKRRGVWEVTTWAGYAAYAAAIGLALDELGPGDRARVAIAADNRPEWLVSDMGAQGIGAVTVGIDPTSPASEVRRILSTCRVGIVVCEDEEQLDKVIEVRAGLPELVAAVVVDPRGVRNLDDPLVRTWADLLARGRALDPAAWQARVEALDPAAPAIVLGTSGEELTSEGLIAAGAAFAARVEARTDDEVLSSLSLSHSAERITSIVQALSVGYVVNFGEGGESFPQDLREVQPTVLLGLPGTWERMQSATEARMNGASFLKQRAYHWCLGRGQTLADRPTSTPADRAMRGLCGLVCIRQLRRKLGLSRVTTAISATAPVAPPVRQWFAALGVEVREVAGV